MPEHALALVAITVVTTLVLVFAVLNFTSAEQRIDRRVRRLYSIDDPRFVQELSVLLGPPVTDTNEYAVLRNGDEIFGAMLASIAGAQHSINFETYIYWSGDIGHAFAEALGARARAGVEVHVLLDWVGSFKMEQRLIDGMVADGVEIRKYHALRWFQLDRLNNRTHRKLLIIDGRVGYTGGVGIAPQWTGRAQDPNHWRDNHYRIEGPVVAQLQSVFIDNWIKVSGDVLHGPDYFPVLAPAGNGRAQMFSSSPEGGSDSMELMYLLAVTSASRTIDLSAAYFVPGRLALEALVEALQRGVRLRIVLPGPHIDSKAVRAASRAEWGSLLALGATIAEYLPTMYHCKVMIVDGLLVSVGSTNFDNRSFRLNDEATLNIVDAEFALEQTQIFEADLALSRQITFAEWQRRPLRERLTERIAALISPEL